MNGPSDILGIDVGSLINFGEDCLLNGNRIIEPESLEIDTKVMPLFLSSPTGPPNKENYPGAYNFHVELNSAYTQKNKFVYSHKLHRIYVDMKQNFSVNFNWNANQVQHSMYVRATVVFSDATQAEKRVERCHQHFYEQSEGHMSEVEKKNVLRSAREMGSPDVFYCGNPGQVNSWYSVLVHFTAPSSHAYVFVCKSSCSSGINRRAISIIYTLEDSTGLVYGQDSVGVRVCSCPRRDLRRDEKDETPALMGKRKVAPRDDNAPRDVIKIARLEGPDDQLVQLPQMTVVGKLTAYSGLSVMLNMLILKRAHRAAMQQSSEEVDNAINDIRRQIEALGYPAPGDN